MLSVLSRSSFLTVLLVLSNLGYPREKSRDTFGLLEKCMVIQRDPAWPSGTYWWSLFRVTPCGTLRSKALS